jgi:hypothetical protein
MKRHLAGFAVALALVANLSTSRALAGAQCTAHPRAEWIPEEAFKQRLTDQKYRIKVFKISGNCYEMYGWNPAGQKVEIYFDTKSGDIVKEIAH